MTIKERILQVAENKKVAKQSFCENIGLTYGGFTGENKKRPINSDAIANLLVAYPEISPDWLLTGQGEMLRSAPDKETPAVRLAVGNEGIPLIPVNAFAGGFTGDTQVLEHECEQYVIPMFNDADFLIPIKGSSMYPKYSSGDVVACKRLTSWGFFQWGKVYVLYTQQGTIIKRICEGKDKEHILVVSDNKERYSPFQLHISEIIDLAIVIGVIRIE
ncbi:MAG: S24 family peptidase [Bacteroidales bacterium]